MANKTLDSLCQDPDYVFSSMDNLYACAEASESLTGNLTDTVYQCLLEYCEKSDPDLLGCPAQVVTDSFEFGVGLDPYPYFADNNGYCDNINKQANTDIGGPGVYASYFIQIGLVLSIWLFLRFFRILPKVLRQLSWVGRKANKTQLSDITAGHSAKIANFFDKQNFVMKSILVELQETQCFFMIACQSVVLLSKNHNGIFSATNMVIVWVDHMIAGLCAAAGILPVVLGLWTLQRSNMCSGWVFFLSTATMITAECALYSVFREPKVSDMTSLRGTFPTSCGQHPPHYDTALSIKLKIP
ncbi:hypothetical protein N7533_013310 [Penicillium manginii]|uniref:uncharacterized protein n=1 Tax=Penicillium manginii TaxID=203109 RepID=UPI002547ABA1|nr:uncharacterized protein N7533_013310 [Penicillium manginii]KAJ5732863.1 hypothetical protein N7533_013310 [Penicillium manginii]